MAFEKYKRTTISKLLAERYSKLRNNTLTWTYTSGDYGCYRDRDEPKYATEPIPIGFLFLFAGFFVLH